MLLGLRHATDPDHLTAVSTLVAAERDHSRRRAAALGLAWGLGHATTLSVFGLPIVLFDDYLPAWFTRAAEVLIGLVIMALAIRLLLRWRAGYFHVHAHAHDGAVHEHVHVHERRAEHEASAHGHMHRRPVRSRSGAYGIGLIHGIGGSAGVGILLLAAIPDRIEGVVALLVFAAFTAASMTVASTCVGAALSSDPVRGVFGTRGSCPRRSEPGVRRLVRAGRRRRRAVHVLISVTGQDTSLRIALALRHARKIGARHPLSL